MDQKKIGAFIAQCRKEKSLTQIQLAELLDITNQAVSKWENGRGMPERNIKEKRKKTFPNFTKKSKLPILSQ